MIFAALMLAGSSTRLNLDLPKQFIEINNKRIFEYPLETFDNNPQIDRIVLVINKEHESLVLKTLESKKYKHKIEIIYGGKTRQESVFNALKHFANEPVSDNDTILIHDACRVLLTNKLLNEIIENIKNNEACVPALRMIDSICIANNKGYIEENVDRSKYMQLQTPQAFKLNFIFKVHQNAINSNLNNFTDDTALAIINGGKVKLVEGDKFNFKVTTFEDLFLLKKIIGG